jgi:hypothetical protein
MLRYKRELLGRGAASIPVGVRDPYALAMLASRTGAEDDMDGGGIAMEVCDKTRLMKEASGPLYKADGSRK